MNRNPKLFIGFNLFLYFAVLVALIGGIRSRSFSGIPSETKLMYNALAYFSIVVTIFVGYGLVKFKNWGRIFAIFWNLALAFILVALKFIALLIMYILSDGYIPENYSHFDIETSLQLVVGVALIYLSVSFNRKVIKTSFI